MRLFLDANVLFTAAHNPQGKAAFLIQLGTQGHWEVYTSALALEETNRNLERKYPSVLGALEAYTKDLQIASQRNDLPYPEGLVEKDQPIFQAALACRASHLLTGDLRDFGPFMNDPDRSYGIWIQTVGEFLAQV